MSSVEKAVSSMIEGYNCCQSVLACYCQEFGLDKTTALKLASAFGGGFSIGETCGAVTGALMVLSLKYGHTGPDDKQAKEKTKNLSRELIRRFADNFGSIKCKELLGCDISTPEGFRKARERDLFKTFCPGLVRCSAQSLERILASG